MLGNPVSSGVVEGTDHGSGGNLTHGSVVAREYGIPAVVGVHDATQTLQTGQRVRIDGNRGIIEPL